MLYQYVPDERDNCDYQSVGKQAMATLECYEFVEGAFHVDRGYPKFAEQLRALGADVTRVD
ncbi:MAG: hypothetical protein ACKOAJ_04380 [Actinomycetota bacterium]